MCARLRVLRQAPTSGRPMRPKRPLMSHLLRPGSNRASKEHRGMLSWKSVPMPAWSSHGALEAHPGTFSRGGIQSSLLLDLIPAPCRRQEDHYCSDTSRAREPECVVCPAPRNCLLVDRSIKPSSQCRACYEVVRSLPKPYQNSYTEVFDPKSVFEELLPPPPKEGVRSPPPEEKEEEAPQKPKKTSPVPLRKKVLNRSAIAAHRTWQQIWGMSDSRQNGFKNHASMAENRE